MKIVRRFLLVVVLAYIGWLLIAVARHPYPGPAAEKDPLEVQGVYHIHSKFSDGWASADSVARAARKAGLDFFILTDHGNPNFRCLDFEGWKDGVLALAGSELSVSRGHLVALDFARPDGRIAQNAEQAVQQVLQLGGFTIIAHPYSKTIWSWGDMVGYSGMEVINGDTMVRSHILPTLPYLPTLLLRPRLALVKTLDDPSRSIAKWDALNREGVRMFAYFSSDAHIFHGLMFKMLRLHALLDVPLGRDFPAAKKQVMDALRAGRFYNAIEAAAPAGGFRFWGEQGGRTIPMGGSAEPGRPLVLQVRAPWSFATRVTLIRDGKTLATSEAFSLRQVVRAPGCYRVEVRLTGRAALDDRVPWIISNPIFLKKD
jgi:hypothetical protein